MNEVKLAGEIKSKGFTNRVYEKDMTVYFESETSDQSILELLDIVDKHSGELKKVATGFFMILKGCNAFLNGMIKDLKKTKKRYAA